MGKTSFDGVHIFNALNIKDAGLVAAHLNRLLKVCKDMEQRISELEDEVDKLANNIKTEVGASFDELLPCPFCGSEVHMRSLDFPDGNVEYVFDCVCGRKIFEAVNKTKAIAAWNTRITNHHSYEQRITGDGSDWGEIMRDAYDDLMTNACESCTSEQMEQFVDYIRANLKSGTLTVEQVRECLQDVYYEGYGDGFVNRGAHINEIDWQRIADELNAELKNDPYELMDADLLNGDAEWATR